MYDYQFFIIYFISTSWNDVYVSNILMKFGLI